MRLVFDIIKPFDCYIYLYIYIYLVKPNFIMELMRTKLLPSIEADFLPRAVSFKTFYLYYKSLN